MCIRDSLLGALLFFLGSDFLGYSVVLGFKVVGANVMWTSYVLAHFYQHTDVVRPFADIINLVNSNARLIEQRIDVYKRQA